MTDSGIALDLRVRAHTDQFRNVHEAVFKDRFGDHAGPFRHQVKQRELGLHIGREARVRSGTHVDRFRTVAVHIEANPVFARFDVSPGVTQFRQNGIQSIRLRVTAEDLAAGNRRGHQEGAGFDTVRQYTVYAATQTLHAFDGNAIGALAFDFRAQRVKEVGGIDNFRLARGVFDNRRPLREGRCAHDSYGSADAHLIHHDMRAFQATVDRGFDITFFQFDLGAQLFQTANVQVDRTRADGAAAWQRNLSLTKTRYQRAQRPDGGTHGFHQVVRSTEYINRTGVNPYRTIALNLRAQLAQQLHGGIDIFQLRYVLDLYRLFGKQRGKEDWQGGVLCTRNGDFALKASRPLNTEFIH